MNGLQVLLAIAGVAVMVLVVGGMILMTPLGEKAVHEEGTAAQGSNLSPVDGERSRRERATRRR
jgi:hypothetical protein